MNYLVEEQSQLDKLQPLFSTLKNNSSEQSPSVVAVDTEFLREKTYSAKLCLIQLGIGENQYCIDVLAIEDLSLVADLFADENVLKLFHAARQDIEVIYQTLNVIPKPIFDTQLAVAFLGADMQIGYGSLVLDRLEIELPKTQSRTDWTRRPLSTEQIQYAGEDVAYLQTLYENALSDLQKNNKLAWYETEVMTFYELDKYENAPALAYKRLSGGGLTLEHQYVLKALAEWREKTAIQRNIPRTWVLRDDKLYELACSNAKTEEQILKLGIFGRKSAVYLAPQASEVINSVDVGKDRLWHRSEPLSKEEKGKCSKMMKELGRIATNQEIAQALLATRKDIEYLYRHRQSKKLLMGWREKIVGEPLLGYIQQHLLASA